jgi:hypothetical protein
MDIGGDNLNVRLSTSSYPGNLPQRNRGLGDGSNSRLLLRQRTVQTVRNVESDTSVTVPDRVRFLGVTFRA